MMSNHFSPSLFVRLDLLARVLCAALVFLGVQPGLAEAGETLTVKAIAQREPVHPGEQFAVAIVMEFGEGWHAWPNVPVVPEELKGDLDAIPTTIKLAKGKDGKPAMLAAGWTVHEGWTQWPTPHEVTTAGLTGAPLTILSYSGISVAFVPVTLDSTTAAGDVKLTFEVFYQACNESVCQRPATETAEVVVKVAAVGIDGKENQPDTFKGFDGGVFGKIASGERSPSAGKVPASDVISPGKATAGATPAVAPGSSEVVKLQPSLFGIELPASDSAFGVIVLLLACMVGGAVMNLTPCVLPVIPIKVMTLSSHAGGSRRRGFILGVWMFIGVVVFWVAVGIPMAFISKALDPSQLIYGNWWVAVTIGGIIALMGLGIMGLFVINLPQSIYMINPKADRPWGSFVFGIMTAVLGLPCYAFVGGGLLAGVATLPWSIIMLVFFGLGFGMGFPYLILAARPELVEKIPRTGPASELVKQVMGLLLLAAAAFFIVAGIQTLISSKPYYLDTIQWWVVSVVVVIAAIWLTVRTLQISKKTWARVAMPLISLIAAFVTVGFANGLTATKREDYLKEMKNRASSELVVGAWQLYTPAKFEQAQASGKIIIADFTANWCILCHSLKQRILDQNPVRAEITKDDVILFEVNCSSSDSEGSAFLRSVGGTGVPTLVVFSPALPKPIMFNAYSSDTVLSALSRARGGIAAMPASNPLP